MRSLWGTGAGINLSLSRRLAWMTRTRDLEVHGELELHCSFTVGRPSLRILSLSSAARSSSRLDGRGRPWGAATLGRERTPRFAGVALPVDVVPVPLAETALQLGHVGAVVDPGDVAPHQVGQPAPHALVRGSGGWTEHARREIEHF